MKKTFSLVCLALLLGGCTSLDIRPVPASEKIDRVYIRANPKVIVRDFVDVMRDGFTRHGIASEIITPDSHAEGKYVVTYTARRNWDMAPYLCDAEIWIEKDGYQIAYAEYHLKGKGGFSLEKWEGTKTKMDPVLDQLLQNINK